MNNSGPVDPAQWFRDMVTQWETMANQFGGEMSKSPEFAKAMHDVNSAQLAVRQTVHETMEKTLAAANIPSRSEIVDLGERLSRIEETLHRIETKLAVGGAAAADGNVAPTAARPKPKRTKKPAAK